MVIKDFKELVALIESATPQPSLRISATEIEQFYRSRPSLELRLGQAFHSHFKLERITGADRSFCDRLYNADGSQARKLISCITDHSQ